MQPAVVAFDCVSVIAGLSKDASGLPNLPPVKEMINMKSEIAKMQKAATEDKKHQEQALLSLKSETEKLSRVEFPAAVCRLADLETMVDSHMERFEDHEYDHRYSLERRMATKYGMQEAIKSLEEGKLASYRSEVQNVKDDLTRQLRWQSFLLKMATLDTREAKPREPTETVSKGVGGFSRQLNVIDWPENKAIDGPPEVADKLKSAISQERLARLQLEMREHVEEASEGSATVEERLDDLETKLNEHVKDNSNPELDSAFQERLYDLERKFDDYVLDDSHLNVDSPTLQERLGDLEIRLDDYIQDDNVRENLSDLTVQVEVLADEARDVERDSAAFKKGLADVKLQLQEQKSSKGKLDSAEVEIINGNIGFVEEQVEKLKSDNDAQQKQKESIKSVFSSFLKKMSEIREDVSEPVDEIDGKELAACVAKALLSQNSVNDDFEDRISDLEYNS